MNNVVYIVSDPHDKERLLHLVTPLEEAGFSVVHNEAVGVGDSLIGTATRHLRSGIPVILCATVHAVARRWARKLVNAAQSIDGSKVLVIEMDEGLDLDHLSLNTVAAPYYSDPQGAIDALIAALNAYFPERKRESDSRSSDGQDEFLDQITTDATPSVEALAEFREQLREDIAVEYPQSLSAWEFLQRTSLMREGRLTRTGVLLVGENPDQILPNAVIECCEYYGTDRSAASAKTTIFGTLQNQIVQANKYIADRMQRGEAPSAAGPYARPVYAYPMIAIREIIANAVAHRNYSSMNSCIHIRVFENRIEVTNPGTWIGQEFSADESRLIDGLAGESSRRNFRLASMLTWIRLVEGEGKGILATAADCRAVDAPIPLVREYKGIVTVTVFPRIKRGATSQPENSETVIKGIPASTINGEESIIVERELPRIGLWGSPSSGKSTFLSALSIAASRSNADLRVAGLNGDSTDFLIRNMHALVSEHCFPSPTIARHELSWILQMSVPNRTRRRWRRSEPSTSFDFRIDLLDAPGGAYAATVAEPQVSSIDPGDEGKSFDPSGYMATCQGLLLFIDPLREREFGDSFDHLNSILLRLAQRVNTPLDQRLPQYVAVCLTKFDDPSVFQFARDRGFLSYSEIDPLALPQVHENEAELFIRQLFAEMPFSDFDLMSGALRQYFYPDRVRYFITSAVGFNVGSLGKPHMDDYTNVVPLGDGTFAIRGQINPIKVVEPLQWLGARIAGR